MHIQGVRHVKLDDRAEWTSMNVLNKGPLPVVVLYYVRGNLGAQVLEPDESLSFVEPTEVWAHAVNHGEKTRLQVLYLDE